ncbi:hypothetical protein HDK90DRAFT_174071 [Phyllosticta capitalensis]|uniref:Uncharacterized protein n=1 Tax=Phyllosticta capitalensis TaxID=121624 RepID=A0ABR1YW03_9PEZI
MAHRPKSPSRIPIPRSPSPAARSRTHKLLRTSLPSHDKPDSKSKPEAAKTEVAPAPAPQTPPDIDVHPADETATETGVGNATTASTPPAPLVTFNRDSSRASSASPVPSITVSVPDSPEQPQPPSPPSRTSSASSNIGGGLHPRRARSLSAGSGSSPTRSAKGPAAMDMRAMAVLCGVPEHGRAVNTIRDLKSEIEELNERVEQGERREDEFAALVQKESEGRQELEARRAEVLRLRMEVEQGQNREVQFAALVLKEKGGWKHFEESQAEAAKLQARFEQLVKEKEESHAEVARLQAQVEQIGRERDEQAALVAKDKEGSQYLEKSHSETQKLQEHVEQISRERDELLRAKRTAVRELDRLKREREREKRECSVAEHTTLHQRLRAFEREREEAAKARLCSMPVHHQFLKQYADKVKEMDREMLALTATNKKLEAREVCTLPIHAIILEEYKDEVIRMDRVIQANEKLLEEKDAAIAAAKASAQEGSQEMEDAKERETRAAKLEACEERLENAKAKFRKDIQSAIDELARQETDTDAWIAHIAQRDVYTREITDEDLERLHKTFQDRTNGLRELKRTILDPSEKRVEREDEEQKRRLEECLLKRDEAVTRATAVIERLRTALKERDVEMTALKKGAKISIDQSKIDPERFDLKWELENKYHGLQVYEGRLNQIDQNEMLKKIEEEIGGKMKGTGDGLMRSTGGPSKN